MDIIVKAWTSVFLSMASNNVSNEFYWKKVYKQQNKIKRITIVLRRFYLTVITVHLHWAH